MSFLSADSRAGDAAKASREARSSRPGAFLTRPRSARSVVLWLGLWLTLAANWSLWRELVRLGGVPTVYLPDIGAMALLVFTGTVALLSFTAWSRWMKPLWIVVVLLAAVVQHYMLAYGVVIDPSMVTNAVQTDPNEVRDLLSWRMAVNVLLVTLPPAGWLLRVRILRQPLWSQLWRNAVLLLAMLALGVGGAMAMYRQLAPLMRNHHQLRYMMNPLATIYSAGVVAVQPLMRQNTALISITAGAALGATYAHQAKPPLFVLVVGETARADHFALNGYSRDTTPELATRHVLSWRNVRSCGTNTAQSLPCMFSSLGKSEFESRNENRENLLDVLQAAGLAVLWIDNQSGCKEVCNRIPNGFASEGLSAPARKALCDGTDCMDDALLQNLDERIAALPPERRAKGIVVVMHQMGSHGPAYYKRSDAEAKRFLPECTTNALAECSQASLVNAFDNSIVYTDHVLGGTIDWLKARSNRFDTGMLYVSDHGESLGEYGLFLHGVPYSFAPDAQKHVPLVMWFGPGMLARDKLSLSCLAGTLDAPLTHDNLYPTVIGILDVLTPTYKPALDMLAACRGPGSR